MPNQDNYTIPARFRRMENLHILFWLVKDTCWCINLRWLGICMIFPTLIIAIVICWRTRKVMAEFTHNLAIIFWITANSYWMVTEFSGWREESRLFALIPFGLGLLSLIYYYGVYLPMRGREVKVK